MVNRVSPGGGGGNSLYKTWYRCAAGIVPFSGLLYINRSRNSIFLYIYSTGKSTGYTHLVPFLVLSVFIHINLLAVSMI